MEAETLQERISEEEEEKEEEMEFNKYWDRKKSIMSWMMELDRECTDITACNSR